MNMSLLVYGNTLLNCGDIINFTVPIMQPEKIYDQIHIQVVDINYGN